MLFGEGIMCFERHQMVLTVPAHFHDVKIIFGKKYCRSSQRAKQEIQEQSSNTEEQATSNSELNTSIA